MLKKLFYFPFFLNFALNYFMIEWIKVVKNIGIDCWQYKVCIYILKNSLRQLFKNFISSDGITL